MVENNQYWWFRRLGLLASILALAVVMLGAWVRLSDAGLGCPDWPGCYGHLTVPTVRLEISDANQAFPERPVETHKAWKEMIHRYFAGSLGLLIAAMAFLALRNRHDSRQPVLLPLVLLGLVIFQALLGMWTVTLQLKPLVVMGHLLGGFATLSLLWWLYLRTHVSGNQYLFTQINLMPWAILGVLLLVMQIALGGWTSSNYAALACPDFPTCQGKWWPETDFREAFVLWRGLGVNYEFGVLEHPARTAIHLTHRIGAVVVAGYLFFLGFIGLRHLSGGARNMAYVLLLLLLTQIGLGISNVIFHLPLPVAVLHNGVAALLLLALLSFVFLLNRIRGVN